ncbi:probable pyruvate dehydrogenase E1 component subunit alpha, mitochondrial [Agrilus planipennis]|uniref:Pyruvate dehydrogenase E1 component subunit alpha n=1 Tax=Agrilus planipennis TaxID=224129 RepID=A0A1W4X808_AGRPL|nr:probable pyruvate dehydrogenase E1 component subunit alpha, mitochondrial [Agrilus planipennis]
MNLRCLKRFKLSKFRLNFQRNYASEIQQNTRPYKLHKLKEPPSAKSTLKKEEALTYYRQMQVIRRVEAASSALYQAKLIRGFCHLYSGQEAVAVGMKAALRPDDKAITSYRSHGWTYLFGATPLEILAEQTGKKTGCQRGKGGSMHTYCKNFYGGNGIVGAQVPLGTGISFALKYMGSDAVCITLYGDGAADQGQIFESFNMACLWKLPAIFVCENNGYSMGTAVHRHAGNPNFYTRGDCLPGLWMDGMDLMTVKEATKYAMKYCKEHGPILIEAATYRYFGHSLSDPGTSYRTREEVAEVRNKRDPITNFKNIIVDGGLVTEDEIKKIDDDVKTEVDKATEQSKTDPDVGVDELVADIYSNNLEPFIRGVTPFQPLQHKRIGKAINLK